MQLANRFAQFLHAKSAGGCAEGTIRQYQKAYQDLSYWLRSTGRRETLAMFTTPTLQDFLIFLASPERRLNINTVHTRVSSLSSFGQWMVRQGLLATNPFDRLDRPKQHTTIPAAFSQMEMDRLLALPLSLKDSAVRALLCCAGLRNSEVCGLDARDVNLHAGQEGMLYVRQAKGQHARPIPLTDARLREPLVSYLLSRGPIPPEEAIFPGPVTDRLTENQLRVVVARWGQQLGRRDLHPHLLRHSFATLWMEHGGDVRVLQDILGHRSLVSTQRYTHVTDQRMRREIERITAGH